MYNEQDYFGVFCEFWAQASNISLRKGKKNVLIKSGLLNFQNLIQNILFVFVIKIYTDSEIKASCNWTCKRDFITLL